MTNSKDSKTLQRSGKLPATPESLGYKRPKTGPYSLPPGCIELVATVISDGRPRTVYLRSEASPAPKSESLAEIPQSDQDRTLTDGKK